MPNSASQNIRDALIPQDVRLRRAIGGYQRQIEALTDLFEKKVLAAMAEIDVPAAKGPLRQRARMVKLQKRIAALAKEHYANLSVISRKTLLGVAKAESQAVTGAIEESV